MESGAMQMALFGRLVSSIEDFEQVVLVPEKALVAGRVASKKR
jgi:hypothetical protein